jgi:hypothetical protein
MKKNYVYAKLPRAGIGNKLLVWARALVFSRINNMPFFVSNWAEIKIGPYLRMEKNKRQYFGYFNSENKLSFFRKVILIFVSKTIHDPALESINQKGQKFSLYKFEKVPSWEDYFKGIRDDRDFIIESFFRMISKRCMNKVNLSDAPVIGVHVRLSDFRDAKSDEEIGSTCNLRTPLSYYAEVIKIIRKTFGGELPVTVFTDGHTEEIQRLLEIPGVKLADKNPDIVDLILLSRSQCIVVSPMSTFSYWASFLSNAIIIKHPNHSAAIRSTLNKVDLFEGSISENQQLSELFVRNTQEINFEYDI